MVESPRPEQASASGEPRWLIALAIAVPVLLFFVLPPLTKSGLWDPYELNVADLSRRIALTLHGASDLALEGADNSLPHLNDLGRPQLAFTSIALGFRLFGLHEWAGRAPLALWGVLGVLATYGFVGRLVDRRAGLFASVALATMPLFFVQARTMLGDVVVMSALAMSFGGLVVATFGQKDDRPDVGGRALWLVIAGVGLVAGWFARGGLLGVAVPSLAVGLSYAVTVASGQRGQDRFGHAVGAASLVLGAMVAALAIKGLLAERAPDLNPFVGALLHTPTKYPTYEFELGHVAFALAPWSAFAPFAFGRLFVAPPVTNARAGFRESQTRLALLVGAAVALVAHGWMAERTELIAFVGPAIIAAGCGIALRDYERGAHPSIAVGVGTLVLLGLFHHELNPTQTPEKAFNAFAVISATFPDAFKQQSYLLWTIVLVGLAGVAVLTFAERDANRKPFDPRGYAAVIVALRDAWDGLLALAYFAGVAGASLAGLGAWVAMRQHLKWFPTLSSQTQGLVLHLWWIVAFVPFLAIFVPYFWADVWLWAFGRRERGPVNWSRGFEPFEDLAARLRNGKLVASVGRLLSGKLVVTADHLEEAEGPAALFLLVPLLYLQVPLIVFVALEKAGFKPAISAALSLPAGVALFLVLGMLGHRVTRAGMMTVSGALLGTVLCLAYYPALANQLSPKEIFESYQRAKQGTEPLALFGVGGRTAAYYAGGQPLILKDTTSAYDWLMGGQGTRRFLAVRSEELPRLNHAYREHSGTGHNLPVLDARSSQIILAASDLGASEDKNQNPLNRIVLSEAPKPQRKLDVNMEDKLQILGIDLLDPNGRLTDHVAPGKKYHLKTYYRVLAPLQSEWEGFIHIDGFHRRHNGDHKICDGKYPMTLWLKDDLIVDDHEFSLEPNFSPGAYTIYFGLFIGETRLKVKSGASDGENRVNAGALKVQ